MFFRCFFVLTFLYFAPEILPAQSMNSMSMRAPRGAAPRGGPTSLGACAMSAV
jgi:hypothetical protein